MLTSNLDWVQVLGLVVSIILPIIVALVTNAKLDGRWKAVLLALLSAVTGFGTEVLRALTEHLPYDVGQGLLSAFAAFIVATAMYFGLWRPTGLTSSGNGLLSGNRIVVHESPSTAQYARTGEPTPLASKGDVTG